jgi:ATP sulfurylase
MTETARTGGRPTRGPEYLHEKSISIAEASKRVHSPCTFFIRIEDISICVSKRKLIGDWWCFPFTFPFVVC